MNRKTFLIILSVMILGFYFSVFCSNVSGTEYKVKSIKTIERNGKSVDWHHELNLIVYGKASFDGYYDVWVMKPDGSERKNLTSGKKGCPQKHNGNPCWHPSGDYIVFTAENKDNKRKNMKWAMPGTGFNCDLWAMTSDGSRFFQLTDYGINTTARAVIHPQFSHNGKKLFWSERVKRGKSFGGGWILKIADFIIEDGTPRLENIQSIKPTEKNCFYESHAFSKDDKKILYSGDLLKSQPPYGLDIYEYNLEAKTNTRLTFTPNDWDEHAHYSPDGKKIAWMSSKGIDIKWGDISGHNWKKYLKTELWIMDTDGSNPRQLTHFNTKSYSEYMSGRRSVVSDSSWGPDGKSIAATVAYENRRGKIRSKVVVIELE